MDNKSLGFVHIFNHPKQLGIHLHPHPHWLVARVMVIIRAGMRLIAREGDGDNQGRCEADSE